MSLSRLVAINRLGKRSTGQLLSGLMSARCCSPRLLSFTVDELADLRRFQVSDEDEHVTSSRCPFHDERMQVESTEQLKSFDEIPGPRNLPLVGNALSYSRLGGYSFEKILDNRMDYMRRYGKIYKEKLGPMWMVHLFDPTDLATMFRLEGRYPSRGKIAGIEVSYLQRNNKLVGFAFRDGPEWARQRSCIQRLMMQPESVTRFLDYQWPQSLLTRVQSVSTRFLDYQWPVARDFADNVAQVVDAEDGTVVQLYDKLFQYTMESIAAVCFGERIAAFGTSSISATTSSAVAPRNDDAAKLSAAIAETFVCFRSTMFDFPWYKLFRTPTYQRFERAANAMRQIMGKYVSAAQRRQRGRLPPLVTSSADAVTSRLLA